jgi:hypothetical protein
VGKLKREEPQEDDAAYFHQYNPSSVEEVIRARLRRQRHAERTLTEMARGNGPNPLLAKGHLGLNEAELGAIRYEGTKRFFGNAKLPEELRAQRERFRERVFERREEFRKNPQDTLSHLSRLQAVLFSSACEIAVQSAAGEFADMLTQAVIGRTGRKDFSSKLRTEMWRECLGFAMRLARWEVASVWIDRAWGHDPRESPIALPPGAELQEEKEAAEAFSAEFRKVFDERMRHGSPSWLGEAERRIELRVLLSMAAQRRVVLDDPSKKAVALLLTVSPNLSAEQICGKLDAKNESKLSNAPIPRSWKKRGADSWCDAHGRFKGSVETYISSIRKLTLTR